MIGTPDHRTTTPGASSFDHGRRNYFCRWCGGYTSADQGAADPKRCSTPGCARPFGLGANMPAARDLR
jgi:hypothetical protein